MKSVSGSQLVVTDGTPKAAYQDATIVVPSTAKVLVNGKPATLADVKPGQRVVVAQLPQKLLVARWDVPATPTSRAKHSK